MSIHVFRVAFLLFRNKSNRLFAKNPFFSGFRVVAFWVKNFFVVFFSCYSKLRLASWLDPHSSLDYAREVWLEALLNQRG